MAQMNESITGEIFLRDNRLLGVANSLIVSAMMACMVASLVEIGEMIAPGWNGLFPGALQGGPLFQLIVPKDLIVYEPPGDHRDPNDKEEDEQGQAPGIDCHSSSN